MTMTITNENFDLFAILGHALASVRTDAELRAVTSSDMPELIEESGVLSATEAQLAWCFENFNQVRMERLGCGWFDVQAAQLRDLLEDSEDRLARAESFWDNEIDLGSSSLLLETVRFLEALDKTGSFEEIYPAILAKAVERNPSALDGVIALLKGEILYSAVKGEAEPAKLNILISLVSVR